MSSSHIVYLIEKTHFNFKKVQTQIKSWFTLHALENLPSQKTEENIFRILEKLNA